MAAVFLGGVSVAGGKGTVGGTIMGVLVMTVLTSSLVLLGIPSYFQVFTTGIIVVIGTALSAYRVAKAEAQNI